MKRSEFINQQIEEILHFVRKFNMEQNNIPMPDRLENGIKLRISNLILDCETIERRST